jgi:hypothetical protein
MRVPNQTTSFSLFDKLIGMKEWSNFLLLPENAGINGVYQNLIVTFNQARAIEEQNQQKITSHTQAEYKQVYRFGINREPYNFEYMSHTKKHDKSINNLFDTIQTQKPALYIKLFMFFGFCVCLNNLNKDDQANKNPLTLNITQTLQEIIDEFKKWKTNDSTAREAITRLLNVELVDASISSAPMETKVGLAGGAVDPDGGVKTIPACYVRTNIPIRGACLLQQVSLDPNVFNSFVGLLHKLAKPDDSVEIGWLAHQEFGQVGKFLYYDSLQKKLNYTIQKKLKKEDQENEKIPHHLDRSVCMDEAQLGIHYHSIIEKEILGNELSLEEKEAVLKVMCEKEDISSFNVSAITQEMLFIVLGRLQTQNSLLLEQQANQLFSLMRRTPFISGGYIHNSWLLRFIDALNHPMKFSTMFIKSLPRDIFRVFAQWFDYCIKFSQTSELLDFLRREPQSFEELKQIAAYQNGEVKLATYWKKPASTVSSSDQSIVPAISKFSLFDLFEATDNASDNLKNIKWCVGPHEYTAKLEDCDSFEILFKQKQSLKGQLKEVFNCLLNYNKNALNIKNYPQKHDATTLPAERAAMIQHMITLMNMLLPPTRDSSIVNGSPVLYILSMEMIQVNNSKGNFFRYKTASLADWITADQDLFYAFLAYTTALGKKPEDGLTWELLMRILEGRGEREALESKALNSVEPDAMNDMQQSLYALMSKVSIGIFSKSESFDNDDKDYEPVVGWPFVYHSNNILQKPSPYPEDIYQSIRQLPLEERKSFLDYLLLKRPLSKPAVAQEVGGELAQGIGVNMPVYEDSSTESTSHLSETEGSRKKSSDKTLEFLSLFDQKDEYICYLVAEYLVAERESKSGSSLKFSACTGVKLDNIPSSIKKLLNTTSAVATPNEQKLLESRIDKAELRRAIRAIPNLEERIIFQWRLLANGDILNTLMEKKRYSLLPNFHFFSQASKVETEKEQTIKLLTILFFVRHGAFIKNKDLHDLIEEKVKKFIVECRDAKEQLAKHHLGGVIDPEEQNSFLNKVLDENTPLGQLYRQPRGWTKPSTERGLLGEIFKLDKAIKEEKQTAVNSEVDSNNAPKNTVSTFVDEKLESSQSSCTLS